MRNTLMLIFFISISLGLKISAQTTTEKNSNTTSQSDSKIVNQTQIPADFPAYVNTGNTTQDAINYDNAKKEWIKNNPEKYREMNGGSYKEIEVYSTQENSNNISKNKKSIEKEIFDTLSTERKDYILAHPEIYSIVESIDPNK